ncbi:DUF1801 domain-containing protein [Niabella drilacis]|uniref:YdhG-like domain-containing protein n=1 Tax=Niabella drilacis (strain DSM 25811 / CCM 8410 / CCUG 62505 / LMG 26954 / E90) TaxID=1285928 RepID=A0A1G6WE54_NIADE|nr:DUF1801 domain-containing protein [Niabella drilacis]SDD64220.1 protein of unknown function (DU1801) [Niabella drilacis]
MEKPKIKFRSLIELFAFLPADQALLLDVLRQIAIDTLNGYGKEKLSYNVPFFYGNRSILLIYPAAVPRGGLKSGVMFAFWFGNRLKDEAHYLEHGTNKQIYYRIYQSAEEINVKALQKLIREAVELDKTFKKNNR